MQMQARYLMAEPRKRGDSLIAVGSPFGALSPLHFQNRWVLFFRRCAILWGSHSQQDVRNDLLRNDSLSFQRANLLSDHLWHIGGRCGDIEERRGLEPDKTPRFSVADKSWVLLAPACQWA
jgi:hypothetical protein